jgi:hypothetical protein
MYEVVATDDKVAYPVANVVADGVEPGPKLSILHSTEMTNIILDSNKIFFEFHFTLLVVDLMRAGKGLRPLAKILYCNPSILVRW